MKQSKATLLLLLTLQAGFLSGCTTLPEGPDGPEWATNIPGKPHTHIVVLPGCSDKPLTFTHVHQGEQVNVGYHKHNGCFVCPPKVSGIKRINQ